MYSPVKLTLRNFISHTDSVFNFTKDKLTLIFGKNEDDKEEGANSNGSGKSAIIEGLTFALTGESYRDVNKDDVIQEGSKESFLEFELYNDFLKEKLVIQRVVKKSSSTCKVFINDKEQEQLTGVPEANGFILEKIGLSKEDLLNFFIINQDNSNSFFTNTDSKQKEIINRFIDTKIVDEAIKKIEGEKGLLEATNHILINNLIKLQSNDQQYDDLIDDELNSVEESSEELVVEFKEEIGVNEISILRIEAAILKNLVLIEEKKAQQNEFQSEIDKFSDIGELRKQIKKEINSNSDLQTNKTHEKKKLQLKLEEAISCPKCNHEFILNHEHEDLDLIRVKISKTDEELIELRNEIKLLQTELETVNNELEKLEVVKSNLENVTTKINDFIRINKTNKKDISDLESRNTRLQQKIEEVLNEEKKESKIPLYEEKKKALKIKILEEDSKIADNKKQIEKKEFQLFHFGKKGFLTYLANESIKTIETYCNIFLDKMNTNLNVNINGYKVLASGDVRDKIEVFILKNGVTKGKFGKYSGGQKERVKLAAILTFFNLINNGLNGKGLNLLCLDESLDHLDELGQKKCLELLKIFDITTLVITHGHAETLLDGYEKVIVSYKNKESSIL